MLKPAHSIYLLMATAADSTHSDQANRSFTPDVDQIAAQQGYEHCAEANLRASRRAVCMNRDQAPLRLGIQAILETCSPPRNGWSESRRACIFIGEAHGRLTEVVTDLTRVVRQHADSLDARTHRIEADVDQIALATARFIDSAQARIKRIEDSADARMKRVGANLDQLAVATTRFIENGDARSKRIEESLDALLRAIIAERNNGRAGK
jgi:hypothetical protein